MNSEPAKARIRQIFLEALELTSTEERRKYLEQACGGDRQVREQVEQLLEKQHQTGDCFQLFETAPIALQKTVTVPMVPALEEQPGTIIGRYKLLEKIGEGGFGVVYMAEQVEPVYRRVALKIIKLGMDTREVIARFDAERQALALMDHPNVSRVLDAGSTSSGRPFFVMELVRGPTITDFCDKHRLTARERIELFIPICEAAQHAHTKGIIHRDLKPSNILVTTQDGRPVPKVIDFGIAKAIQQPLTNKTLFTHFGQLIGTPIYMSPEHLMGEDVDTRSDVYSLGVILYELLTGKQPFDPDTLRKAGQLEMLRIIEEEEPPPPSTRLTRLGQEISKIAELRHTTPRRLSEIVRGDLDWITMKALQKNRARRYETPWALAEDLQRHLSHQPVKAGPPSVAYRALKFMQRHRYGVAAASGIFLALLVGLVLASIGFLDAREQAARALAAESVAIEKRELALQEANKARANESRMRQISYASDMGLASHALEAGNLGRVLSLLNRNTGNEWDDLRGWEWRYLWEECRSDELFQLGTLSNSVISLSISADGTLVAASDLSSTLAVWDLPARKRLFSALSGSLSAIISPDARSVITGDGSVRDAASGRLLKRIPIKVMKKAVFSADGRYLAILDGANLYLLKTEDWSTVFNVPEFPCLSMHVGGLVVSQDWIGVGSEDGYIHIVESATGKTLRRWRAHQDRITALALSPDETLLASGAGYFDDQVKLWRASDGSLLKSLLGHRAWISSLSFSSGGQTLASGSADQTIAVWDMASFGLLARLKGHLHEVWAVAYASDGRTLVSSGKDGSIKVWRTPTPPKGPTGPTFALQDPAQRPMPRDVIFSPDGREVIGLNAEGRVGRWSVPGLNFLAHFECLGAKNYLVTSSADSILLGSVREPSDVQVMSVASQTVVTNIPIEAESRITWLGFAACNLVVVDSFYQVHVYDSSTWERRARWTCNTGPDLRPVAISPDGHYLMQGGRNPRVYSLADGQTVTNISAHQYNTDAVAFSPDGKLVATGSMDGTAKLWQVGSWEQVGKLTGHLLGIHSVSFSPDGKRLATGSVGREAVKLWDLTTQQEVLNLISGGDMIFWLGFSPDGRTLGACGTGSGLKCWSAPLLTEVRELSISLP